MKKYTYSTDKAHDTTLEIETYDVRCSGSTL